MPVGAIDHVNLRAPRALLEELREFYEQALGLEVGARPPFPSHGYWLYAGGLPLVHLQETEPGETRATGVATTLDHVALACTDLPAMTARLEARGIPYRLREVPLTGARQLFLRDPAGNGVELLFAAD